MLKNKSKNFCLKRDKKGKFTKGTISCWNKGLKYAEYVAIRCYNCGIIFEKLLREVKQHERKNLKFYFCNQSCQHNWRSKQPKKSRKESWTQYNRSEKKKKVNKKWAKNNPDKIKENKRRRRLRKLNADGWHTIAEWELLKKQYGYTCLACGKKESDIKLTEDHIIPLIKGGSDNIENIQPLCISCNCKKRTKIIFYESTR